MILPNKFSSVRGKIRYLFLAFNNRKVALPMLRFLALRAAMPGVQLVLWCSRADVAEAVSAWLDSRQIGHTKHAFDAAQPDTSDCLVVFESFSNINTWVRDAFWASVLQGGQGQLLDMVDEDASDQGWAKRLVQWRAGTDMPLEILGPADNESNNLGIAGGNVLADLDWLFLGKPAPILEKLFREQINPGVRVIILTEQTDMPWLYHLDLFLTLSGQELEGRYVVLLGKCVALAPGFQGTADAVNHRLDQLALRLETDYDLKVIRNPLLLGDYLFSYNNCIVEVTENEKNVWLPAYTFDFPDIHLLRTSELENRQIWQQLGFNPHMIEASFQDLYGAKAGLHCITNEIRQ